MTTLNTLTEVKPQKPWKGRQRSIIPTNLQHAKDSLAQIIITLGFIIAGKKVKKLFYMSVLFVPLFGLMIVYSIHCKNFWLLISSQLLWGASFTFIQVPIIPFIMRNSIKED